MKFEENDISISIPKYPKTFIYFLIKKDNVVYVGQTKIGLLRPLSHKDKEFDSIKIIPCKEEEVDILEDKYIEKYRPNYNRMMNTSMNYSLTRTRNLIRKTFNNNIDLRQLKKIIDDLKIEMNFSNNGIVYIKRYDFEKIIKYIEETKNIYPFEEKI